MLFNVWTHLIAAGPGSSHLEMMDIILKNEHYPLWKHMKASIMFKFKSMFLPSFVQFENDHKFIQHYS